MEVRIIFCFIVDIVISHGFSAGALSLTDFTDFADFSAGALLLTDFTDFTDFLRRCGFYRSQISRIFCGWDLSHVYYSVY